MDKFDIIFVYSSSRVHPCLLHITKYLSSTFKIGILLYDLFKIFPASEANRRLRLKNTEEIFLNLCNNFGAHVINFDTHKKYLCDLLILPQGTYKEDFIKSIDNNIHRKNTVALQGFAHLRKILDYFNILKGKKFLLFDRGIFSSIAKEEKVENYSRNICTEEAGVHYLEYPIWDKADFPQIDYLIALPTLLFLKNHKTKLNLMKNIYNSLVKLNPEDKVVIKLHNVRDGGNRYVGETKLRSKYLAKISETFLGRRGIDLSSAIFYHNILHRAVPLSSITPYYNLGLELFLPYVKKGVITGISTVIWHCLYNKIPVYNCDNQPFGEHLPNYNTYKNFYIPYCGDDLSFDKTYFNKISDSARNTDLIRLIEKEISQNEDR